MSVMSKSTVAANDGLRNIQSGPVGFDTEYTTIRRLTVEEQHIVHVFPAGGDLQRNTMVGWPIVESKSPFPQLRKVSACVWYRLRTERQWSIPVQLLRIFQAVHIHKVGDDLRIEKKILVDASRTSETLH
ncbi:hypothetical protein B0H13DRAFT_1866879 [Mycena leptocephala]|nr:hypothetical protein B0H13DRAFT_1866879 [Mycena leptocephala]